MIYKTSRGDNIAKKKNQFNQKAFRYEDTVLLCFDEPSVLMHDMQRFNERRHVLILWHIRMSRCPKNQKDKSYFCKNKILRLLSMQTTFDFRGFTVTALITPFLTKPNSSCLSFVFFLKKQNKTPKWTMTEDKREAQTGKGDSLTPCSQKTPPHQRDDLY